MNADFYKLVRTLESLTEETPEPKKLDNGKSVLKESNILEMDKSQPSSDRGGESSGDPYAKGGKATPIKPKDMSKHALKVLNKKMNIGRYGDGSTITDRNDPWKGVKEEQQDESALQAYLGKKKYGEKGMKALQQAGREGASKEEMAKIRAKHDKMDEDKGTAVPWQVVINALASGYPDLDPTDSLRPIMRKYGVEFDDLNLLAKQNGYNNIYDVLDEFGGDQDLAEGGNIGGEPYDMEASLRGKSVDELNSLIKKLEGKPASHADAHKLVAAAKKIRAEKIGKKNVSEGSLNEGQYEMMMRNGQVKKFIAKDDADAKRIAAGHGAKSVIRLKGGVPAGKVSEQGVAEGSLEEVSLDLAKRARDKAEYFVDMDYDDLRAQPYGYSEKQRKKFQRYIDRKEPRAKGDRDWDPPNKGVAEGSTPTYVLKVMDATTGEHWSIEVQASSPDLAKERAQQQGLKVLRIKEKGVAEGQLKEVAPPGAKAERMVKHIKAGYAKDGKLSDKEKSIAYATAWKAHNKGKVEEGEVWRPGMPLAPNPDMGSSLTPREQRKVVTPQGPEGVQQPYLPEPKKPAAQPKKTSELSIDTDVAETKDKSKIRKSDRFSVYQESVRYKTINRLIKEEFNSDDNISLEEKDIKSALGDNLFNELQAVKNNESEMSEQLKDALFTFYKNAGELPPEVSRNDQDITEYIKDRIMSMSGDQSDDRLSVSEDMKVKGTRYGGSAQTDDQDDDDETGEKKSSPAQAEKRGRGRPRKDSGDANTQAKYSGAKDLQSFMVGNMPKKSKSLEKLPTTKHKIKG